MNLKSPFIALDIANEALDNAKNIDDVIECLYRRDMAQGACDSRLMFLDELARDSCLNEDYEETVGFNQKELFLRFREIYNQEQLATGGETYNHDYGYPRPRTPFNYEDSQQDADFFDGGLDGTKH